MLCLILLSVFMIALYDSYIVTGKLELRHTFYNSAHFFHSHFFLLGIGGGLVLPPGHPHDFNMTLTPCGSREPLCTFSKPLYSQVKLCITPSPDAVWEGHRFFSQPL